MTIHHDKLAYGRLARSQEEADEEKLKQMAQKLSEKEKEPLKEDDKPVQKKQ
ncbi:MAG: hypothetical protein LUF82_05730 [Clostridia bacterium]|nr:hypothetical protein [Clostridia bacterium]